MRKMKQLILILGIVAMASISSLAQTKEIVYEYDDAGNREKRIYNVIPENPPVQENTEESNSLENTETEKTETKPEVYEDLLGEQQIKVYPNPTRGKLLVEMVNYNLTDNGSIQVFDMSGRLVQNLNKLSQNMVVNITNEPPGSYIMMIIIGKEKSEWKIVKQ